jgi:hypothetical protein
MTSMLTKNKFNGDVPPIFIKCCDGERMIL